MSAVFSPSTPLRVAIIGSGPSGIFAAEALLRSDLAVQVDILDRLPTPYGLVRYGVAPDHLAIKSVTKGFDKTLSDPRVRFLGHVELGQDVQYAELRARYHALIYACGASRDRRLRVPGEDLRGSLSATEFVAWYNGHPDAQGLQPPLHARGVAVVGLGNVALDVSRILAKTPAELHASDIAPSALDALERSAVQDIYILGRRGPAQAKFTTKELREFAELEQAEPLVRAAELALSPEEEASLSDQVIKKNLEVLREFAARTPVGKPRRVYFRFLVSPAEVLDDGQGAVGGLKIERNRLDAQGRAVGTGEFEVLPVQWVLRSVGYQGVPLPDVPFDAVQGIIPHREGRVEGRVGEYAVGWIKRGPSGVIGTNRKDATDTVRLLLADAQAGLLPELQAESDLTELLQARGVQVFSFADWQKLDAFEQSSGAIQGRPRLKVVDRAEMLSHV